MVYVRFMGRASGNWILYNNTMAVGGSQGGDWIVSGLCGGGMRDVASVKYVYQSTNNQL